MRRLKADSGAGLAFAVTEAADVVRAGGVVAFPTDTLYGLAVDPFNADAVARLFAVKGRASGQAIALVAADPEQVTRWIAPLDGRAKRLADAFWPGPLTVLLKPTACLLAAGIVAPDGTVGVRVPAHAVAAALCRAAGRPLTATSANLSGGVPTPDPEVVWRSIGDRIDLLLDGGTAPGGPPSTLVDVSGEPLRLVRAGAIDWDTIQRCVT